MLRTDDLGVTMTRFILLSFGFLAWAFYEMSGGADFEPRSAQMARLNPAPETQTADLSPQPSTAPITIVDTDPTRSDEVTRVSLNLTTLQETLETESPEPPPLADATPDPAEDFGVPRNVGSVASSADTPAIIPSLITPTGSTPTPAPATLTASASDIRTVSGSRVNVRGGPGTDFAVVTRLTRGAEVRIIEDTGNGWVRMQPLDGSPEGWMADFLLTSG